MAHLGRPSQPCNDPDSVTLSLVWNLTCLHFLADLSVFPHFAVSTFSSSSASTAHCSWNAAPTASPLFLSSSCSFSCSPRWLSAIVLFSASAKMKIQPFLTEVMVHLPQCYVVINKVSLLTLTVLVEIYTSRTCLFL